MAKVQIRGIMAGSELFSEQYVRSGSVLPDTMFTRDSPMPLLLGAMLFLTTSDLYGIVFFETGDPAHNREIAPGGQLSGSGWQHQGEYKDFLGTVISPRHFITAIHIGKGPTTFVQKSWFTGEAADRVYFINPNFNNGNGSRDIPGTDLRIFEIHGEFPVHAELYTTPDEAGRQVVMIGRGRPRGEEVSSSGQTRGWLWGPGDNRVRWGTNTVDGFSSAGIRGPMLVTDFDDIAGSDECQGADGDSGGAVFIRKGNSWKLAGILFAADSVYDTNTVCGDASEFLASMFNGAGFYTGGDDAACDNWTLISAANDLDESRTYASRISVNAQEIQAVIQPAIDDKLKTARQRYDEWLAGFGVVSGVEPGDDAESDSWPNIIEYLADLDPSVPEELLLPFSLKGEQEKICFKVRIRMDAQPRGLNWEIEGTNDLAGGNYQTVTGLDLSGVTRSLAEGVETMEYEIDRPSNSRMFYRLRVTLGQ